jgi:hypothetical protein
MSENTAALKLSSLEKRIRGAAHNIAFEYGADPDDVESEITLAILEEATRTPSFLDRPDNQIVNLGAWRARDWLRREYTQYYNRTVSDDPLYDEEPAGGMTLLDLAATDDPWAFVELSAEVWERLAGLDEQNRTIATALAAGFNPREIGPALGISYRTVYNRMNGLLRETLAEVA